MEIRARAEPEPAAKFSTGCCAPFAPSSWNDDELIWRDKPFVRDHVRCLFHVPLGMEARVIRNQQLIEAAHAKAELPLMLCDEASPWGTDLFIAVSRDVPGAHMARLSGTFLTKVYEGPYRNAGKWSADMRQHVASKGRELEKLYFAYMTCPRCAKAYEKNYVVAFAKVYEAD
jgi:hypothetical protein